MRVTFSSILFSHLTVRTRLSPVHRARVSLYHVVLNNMTGDSEIKSVIRKRISSFYLYCLNRKSVDKCRQKRVRRYGKHVLEKKITRAVGTPLRFIIIITCLHYTYSYPSVTWSEICSKGVYNIVRQWPATVGLAIG